MSDISFDAIPSDIRVPFAYIEFNNSNAIGTTPAPRQRVLMFGQRNMVNGVAAGTGPTNEPVQIYSASQAAALWGAGSMIARMVGEFIEANRVAELWCIAQENGGGDASAGTISLSGTATDSGVLVIYIAGQRLTVTVYADDTGVTIAESLIAKINATSSLPVTAAAGAASTDDNTLGSVVLTAKFIGQCSVVDVRLNYYSGESTPAGVAFAVTYPTGNKANPDMADAIGSMGDLQYKYIVMPYLDAANLALLNETLTERWGPINQADGFAVGCYPGSMGDLTTYGLSHNKFLISSMGVQNAPEPSYLWAATIGAIAAQSLTSDPARPLQTLVLTNRMAPAPGDRFNWTERNTLLYDGISTFTVNDDGGVQIERLITMYRVNSYGDTDPSYLDVTTIATLSYLRYSTRVRIQTKFPRHKLADDGTSFASGQAVVTPSIIKAELLALFTEWETAGLVEDFTTYKDELLVVRNKADRNRVDVLAGPNLMNQFMIFAEQIRFIL